MHQRAKAMLEAAEEGLDAINPLSSEPTGALRITAPAYIIQTALMDDFANFSHNFPKVDLKFSFSDRPSEIIKDGFDVAIRAGWLQDSDHMVRKIGHADRFLVASPEYVAAKTPPRHPSDLEDWDWIRFAMRTDQTELTSTAGETVSVLGKSKVSVNSADALYEFATRGAGLTAIPESLASRGFARGELVQVLAGWKLNPLGLYAIWPNQSRRENLTTLFVRFIASDT